LIFSSLREVRNEFWVRDYYFVELILDSILLLKAIEWVLGYTGVLRPNLIQVDSE
jgi:hypothetical protein